MVRTSMGSIKRLGSVNGLLGGFMKRMFIVLAYLMFWCSTIDFLSVNVIVFS